MTDEQKDLKPGDEAPPDAGAAAQNICPACEGSGRQGDDMCDECRGTGEVREAVGGG